ncbi:hypothetical protein BDZ89DRAFT_1066166 [Hymenopellis radicata]|nr:hypothetical protein BDZ89DRAFT_1066166 [Hymenopellis radicata]
MAGHTCANTQPSIPHTESHPKSMGQIQSGGLTTADIQVDLEAARSNALTHDELQKWSSEVMIIGK